MLKLDHIVLAAQTLDEGITFVEERLKLKLDKGARHDMFGTHNRLLALGNCYFEVIALDPKAKPTQRALWYELGDFSGVPRLITWVCETDDMTRDLSQLPYNAGKAIRVTRDDLVWDLTIADNGKLPLNGCAPSIIDWKGTQPPTFKLPERDCRLQKLKVSHPNIAQINPWLKRILNDSRVELAHAKKPAINLILQTPNGSVTL